MKAYKSYIIVSTSKDFLEHHLTFIYPYIHFDCGSLRSRCEEAGVPFEDYLPPFS